jgi:hypothetical protein
MMRPQIYLLFAAPFARAATGVEVKFDATANPDPHEVNLVIRPER